MGVSQWQWGQGKSSFRTMRFGWFIVRRSSGWTVVIIIVIVVFVIFIVVVIIIIVVVAIRRLPLKAFLLLLDFAFGCAPFGGGCLKGRVFEWMLEHDCFVLSSFGCR